MREQREPWLTLPERESGSRESSRADARFRTHIVTIGGAAKAPAAPSTQTPNRLRSAPATPEPVLPRRPSGTAPTLTAIERAAAAATIARPLAQRPSPRQAETATLAEESRPSETRAPAASEIGLDDLSEVSSADWLVKVGEAAKMVDVVVVFYSAASLGSAMFQRAFRTVVNEMLPRLGRPYAVYRFSLDAEPGFVAAMTESLALADVSPIAGAGFAWSGPGRRLFLIGDHALESPAAFQRLLRQYLSGERVSLPDASRSSQRPATALESPPGDRSGSRAPIWGGRVVAILAWCLFGTAALGAAVVGVAPQWASSLLHPTAHPGPAQAGANASPADSTPTGAGPPAVGPDSTASLPPAATVPDQAKAAKPVRHARKKQTPSSLSLNPTYWGLPETRGH